MPLWHALGLAGAGRRYRLGRAGWSTGRATPRRAPLHRPSAAMLTGRALGLLPAQEHGMVRVRQTSAPSQPCPAVPCLPAPPALSGAGQTSYAHGCRADLHTLRHRTCSDRDRPCGAEQSDPAAPHARAALRVSPRRVELHHPAVARRPRLSALRPAGGAESRCGSRALIAAFRAPRDHTGTIGISRWRVAPFSRPRGPWSLR